ncbi:MAG: hypothetical protein SCM11_19380 [Bacillota bacterium]|nr:hypothetical protein [Bacillota bacterium]
MEKAVETMHFQEISGSFPKGLVRKANPAGNIEPVDSWDAYMHYQEITSRS